MKWYIVVFLINISLMMNAIWSFYDFKSLVYVFDSSAETLHIPHKFHQ